jgi:hypothetical protein
MQNGFLEELVARPAFDFSIYCAPLECLFSGLELLTIAGLLNKGAFWWGWESKAELLGESYSSTLMGLF